MLISINERPGGSDNADPSIRSAVIRFDHGPEYPFTLRNPFSEQEEQDLEWYFEDHLRQPFLKQVKAHDVAASIKTCRERLFAQVFADPKVYVAYNQAKQIGAEFVGVIDNIAKRQLLLKQHKAAEVSYDRALSIHNGLNIFDERQKTILIASIYHSLGMVAEAQRQWAQAEQYYQKALAIKIDFNDRHSQASTYHQLGRVAQEQRQWAQAEEYYQKALAIYIDFNDRYEQASTYHQLGMVAQAQRQWAQAEQYYHKALAIYIEFDDQYWAGNTVWRLAHLWQESGDNNLPGRLASWLGIAPAEAEELLRQRLEASSPQENTNSEASP